MKVTVSENDRNGLFSNPSRLAAVGGRAVSAGQCFIQRISG